MPLWKLILAYDGTHFHGWQVQPGLRTIQGALAASIRSLTGEDVLPQGSGRTDAGVHALGQVASFRLGAAIPPANFLRALNRALPASIRVLSAEHVGEGFHARHRAVSKTYSYRIFPGRDHGAICSPMLAPYVWDCPWRLQLECLAQAAAVVLGEHDFTSFSASDPDLAERESAGSSKSPVRTILRSQWIAQGDCLIYTVAGSGFLHHMVRNLVGTFVEAGRGALPAPALADILEARSRSAAGPTAPAQGLFLEHVEYGLASAYGEASA